MKKLIILFVILITFSSCRVAKKSWVEENFTASEKLKQTLQELNETTEKKFQDISESFTSKIQEVSNSSSSSSIENESENTSVSGSITAEDGKEKIVTVGGTTIKSNGANLTFDVNSSKSVSKEFHTKFQEISKQLESESNKRIQSEQTITELLNRVSELESNKEYEKSSKSKDVKTSGLTFGTMIWIGLIVLVVLILLYLNWRYKLIAKVGKLFTNRTIT